MSKKQRSALVADHDALPPDAPRVLLSTGKLVGEGFDHPPLDTLVLAMPVSWKGTLQQCAGRLRREHACKADVRIIDFVDTGRPALLRMWDKRQAGYLAMGYRVGSDVPAEWRRIRPARGHLYTLLSDYKRTILSLNQDWSTVMRYSSQVKPISYLKANAAEVLTHLAEQREPMVITQNGEAKAVLQDVASFEETQETLALLKILALGNQDVAAGKVKPVADVVARLRAKQTPI